VGRWVFAVLAAAVAVVGVVVAGLSLPGEDSNQAVPVSAADLAVIVSAAQSCPAVTAPRLAGQLMAASALKPSASSSAVPGGAGIAGLSDAVWKKWAPAAQANRGSTADNIVALAHDMCDLTGQARAARIAGDAWRAALGAFHSGMAAVIAAGGVPADARDYVDTVSRYAAWYARRPEFSGTRSAPTATPHGSPSGGNPASSSSAGRTDGNVTGTGSGQFQYDANWGLTTGVADMYAGTANWSQVAGATATFRFAGTLVALHAVRDVDQGIMTVTVDGGTPQSVDNYAATRNASGVVWTSRVLSSGTHTITIVNTGQHNSASSGINIAIDWSDVTP
jgi:hypothetical protein